MFDVLTNILALVFVLGVMIFEIHLFDKQRQWLRKKEQKKFLESQKLK